MKNINKLTTLGLLSCLALIIFVIESYLPPLGITGAKLGLSNIVVLFTMVIMGRKEAFGVLVVKILLGALFSGNVFALVFSIFGGFSAFAVMSLSVSFLNKNRLFLTSVIGGTVHNIGQLFAAFVVMKTSAVFFYTPYLVVAGILTGLFTGVATQFTLKLYKNIKH